jgi:hypothetical protein
METVMTSDKSRLALIVTAGLFLGWLGFLLFLVIDTRKTHVARAQFLIAKGVVVVHLKDDGGKANPDVAIKEVLFDPNKSLHAGQNLRLTDLLGCTKKHGYSGSGDYVIALEPHRAGWQIAAIPTPGYSRPNASHGSIDIIDAGKRPDLVLGVLLDYAREKPREADDLLEPLLPVIAVRQLGRMFFGPEPRDDEDVIDPAVPTLMFRNPSRVFLGRDLMWEDDIAWPRGPLPRRLPKADAEALDKQLKAAGAKVNRYEDEVRIYPATGSVRSEVAEITAPKTKK